MASLGITDLSVFGGIMYRRMLFNVNEDGLANDLIYTTPTNYPITRIQPRFDVESNLVINHYVELEELLKYLNYGVDLTQRDLNEIYNKLISHKWWLEHHVELFGYQKLNDGSFSSGGVEVLSRTIYDNLSSISCFENGKPNKNEPGYSLIRKKKIKECN